MVSTDTITRNSDGTYTSEYGYSVSKGPGGDLWVGGAPTGYRDIGFGVQRTPSPWESYQPTVFKPQQYTPPPMPATYGGAYAGVGYPLQAAANTTPDIGLSFGLLVYPWMLLLACASYIGVSATPGFLPPGLHLHPIYGVAAFLGTIWLYRQMMVFLPTALLLALPAAATSGLIAWLISDAAGLQRFGEQSFNLAKPWVTLQALWPILNGWVIATTALSLLAHLSYWRYRRRKVRQTGWVFNRSPLTTAQDILIMAAASGALGWGIAWAWKLA